jgi:hypothetical protein
MFFGEIEAFASLLDRVKAMFVKGRADSHEPVAVRFVRVFESHGVHRTQIPRFFGCGITLKGVENFDLLTDQLTEDALKKVCALFCVNREWLDGASSQVHPVHSFYKHPKEYVEFVEKLIREWTDLATATIDGVVLAPSTTTRSENGLVILQQPVGTVEERPIYKFHLIECEAFSYWKTRGYLAALCAASWARGVYLVGRTIEPERISRLASGEELLGWSGEGIHCLQGAPNWYPEDLALNPNDYLLHVDPERENFGLLAALQLWLDLQVQGEMRTNFETGKERDAFIAALKALQC